MAPKQNFASNAQPKAPASGGSLHVILVDRLRPMITSGRLEPGTRINENQLCKDFGVSRTPLREALKVLASEGLVELLRNRGARVVRTTPEDLRHIFTVMSALEALAGELAAREITDEQFNQIRTLHGQMLEAYMARDEPRYYRLNEAIHEGIVEISGNPVLTALRKAILGRVLASRFQTELSRERWAAAIREHEIILRLLEMRQATELGMILRNHIMNKFESIRTDFENESRSQAI